MRFSLSRDGLSYFSVSDGLANISNSPRSILWRSSESGKADRGALRVHDGQFLIREVNHSECDVTAICAVDHEVLGVHVPRPDREVISLPSGRPIKVPASIGRKFQPKFSGPGRSLRQLLGTQRLPAADEIVRSVTRRGSSNGRWERRLGRTSTSPVPQRGTEPGWTTRMNPKRQTIRREILDSQQLKAIGIRIGNGDVFAANRPSSFLHYRVGPASDGCHQTAATAELGRPE
jgi:hypothetical protein